MKVKLLVIFALLVSNLSVAAQPEVNRTDSCVNDYAAEVDYFPQKVEIRVAAKFSVAYFDNYKVVSVADAYDGASSFDYVLVQCGTPAPSAAEFAAGTQFINVPTRDLITLSTTQLPALTQLGLLEHLIGVDSGFYIGTPEVVELIAAGEVAEVGFGSADQHRIGIGIGAGNRNELWLRPGDRCPSRIARGRHFHRVGRQLARALAAGPR